VHISHAISASPTWHPLYGQAKADTAPAPKTLHAGIQESRSLNFGAILIKDNNDFPKNYFGVPFRVAVAAAPQRIHLAEKRPATAPSCKTIIPIAPILVGNVRHQALAGQAEKDFIALTGLRASKALTDLRTSQALIDQQASKTIAAEQQQLQSPLPVSTGSDASAPNRELNSQPSYQYQPGWMSYQTSSQTTHHQYDYNEQQSQSNFISQQSTQYQTEQTMRSKKSSSSSGLTFHLGVPHSVISFIHHGTGLINHAQNFVNGAGNFASGAIIKIGSPIDKVSMLASSELDKIDVAVSTRIDRVQQSVSKRVRKVTTKVATRVDNTVRKAGSAGYDTTKWTVNQVWHPGWLQQISNKVPPANSTAVITEAPPQDNVQAVTPDPSASVEPAQPTSNVVTITPIAQGESITPISVIAAPDPVALNVVAKRGPFVTPSEGILAVPPRHLSQIDVNWDAWYRTLLSQACIDWSSNETLPGRVDLLVTVRADGQVACEPASDAKSLAYSKTLNGISESGSPVDAAAMLKRAETAVHALSQNPISHFPINTKRRNVTFEVVFVSTADGVPNYVHACAPDIEHVVVISLNGMKNYNSYRFGKELSLFAPRPNRYRNS
jgi:hypothetical protein